MNNFRTPDQPPVIAPLPAATVRPFWSVMIPVYNCSNYLVEALTAVLEQAGDESHMQIEVIDDASTDADVEELVQKIGKGRVRYFRQVSNVGSLRNFETCINRASGQWIHILHGDDLIEKNFYSIYEKTIAAFPTAGMVFSGFHSINEFGNFKLPNKLISNKTGEISNWIDIISTSQQLQPPCAVVKRSVYEQLGSFYAVHYGEDWLMWVRIAMHFKVIYIPEHLAFYRLHAANISSQSFVTGQHIKDIRKLLKIIKNELPADKRTKLNKLARYNWACYFARTADRTYNTHGLPRKALEQCLSAMDLHFNRITFFYFLKTVVKNLVRK